MLLRMMPLMVTMLKMQVEVGDQEEKVALASRVRLQETFTKDVIETTKCQVIMMMMISPKKATCRCRFSSNLISRYQVLPAFHTFTFPCLTRSLFKPECRDI